MIYLVILLNLFQLKSQRTFGTFSCFVFTDVGFLIIMVLNGVVGSSAFITGTLQNRYHYLFKSKKVNALSLISCGMDLSAPSKLN